MEHEQMGKDTETEAVDMEGERGEGERGRRKGTLAGRQAGRSSRWRPPPLGGLYAPECPVLLQLLYKSNATTQY